jgi:hypothetical protein
VAHSTLFSLSGVVALALVLAPAARRKAAETAARSAAQALAAIVPM